MASNLCAYISLQRGGGKNGEISRSHRPKPLPSFPLTGGGTAFPSCVEPLLQ